MLEGNLYWYSNNMLLRVPADSADNAFVDRFRLEGYDRIVDIAAVSHKKSSATSSAASAADLASAAIAHSARSLCRCDFFCVPTRSPGKAFRCGCPQGLTLSGLKKCVRKRACPPDQTPCRNSQSCIPNSWLCDGNEDCSVRDWTGQGRA